MARSKGIVFRISQKLKNLMKFSIVIPIYNEEKLLSKCLESLTRLDYSQRDFEIIAVDNNSTDMTSEILNQYSRAYPFVKVISEKKQGNVFALIAGCQNAQGEILVFTDADTIAPKNWLKNYEKAYQNEKVVCAGGGARMRPVFLKARIVERAINLAASKLKFYCGFNMSIRRIVYQKIGGFDPRVNFDQDFFLIFRAKKFGSSVFVNDNEVITSSRRFKSFKATVYLTKSLFNIVSLSVFKKALFFEFDNVRD